MPVSPTGQFKESRDCFYVTDSHLSVTDIAKMAMFYIKLTIHNDFHIESQLVELVSLIKVLTVSMI